MSKQLTMTEVANELGLSRNAVSAVMNNRARKFGLSVATENRIREYIDKSGYVQARHALQTKTGDRNNTVDLLYCGEFPRYSHVREALAAIGATSEDPKSFGKSLIFVALGESIALYGVVISILILNKL